MSNMSYCKFQNTLSDLRECIESINEDEEVSPEESRARKAMINEIAEMAFTIGFEIDDDGAVDEFINNLATR